MDTKILIKAPDTAYQFFTDTSRAWEAMLEDISKATTSVELERYIFLDDEIGGRFLGLLKTKALSGVKVRILLDMVGSFLLYISPKTKELTDAGIEIKFFNPISPWRIANVTSNFFRNHRKLLIIDDAVVYIGSSGIDQKTILWRETEVRCVGTIALDFKNTFETLWQSTLRQKFLRFKQLPTSTKNFEVMSNSPRFRERVLYHTYIEKIRRASSYIYLSTPYFIPDIRFFRALRLQARRGVDVRIIIPRTSDYSIIDNSNRSYFTLALQAGIKIYLYEPSMFHAKTATIDDWATVGTFNLDQLSFRFNYEINLTSTEPKFIDSLKNQFLEDCTHATEVKYDEWIKRPFIQKLKEFITWPFHSFF